ncbi:MAG: gliding motility-associated C-terminal domain-containing protein [Saprospiraceae bacterium]
MRFLYISLTFLFVSFSVSLFAQCPPPGFPNSGSNCGNPIICENLDDYCTEINNSNQPRNYPCCAGWQLNNDEWFGFFAGTTTITLEITPSNCDPGGQQGLQAAIYDNCPAFPPPAGWCNANLMDAQCSCTDDPFQLTATDFIVGEVYWFVIDGCSGNVCDYEIQVLEGSTTGFPPDDPGVVTGPSPFCQGTAANYNVPPINGATTYTWTLNPAGAGTLSGNNNHGDITVTWASGFSGTATLCVKSSNLCFSNADESCITVEVLPKPTATLSGSGVLCTSEGNSVDLTVTLTGDPDWTFIYAINGVSQPAITTSTSPYIITATQPGTYTLVSVVSVDSDPDCAGTVSGSVVINQVTLNPSSTTVAAICGQNNGSVDLSVGGNGNAPYTYSWSGGETTQDLSNVPPGTYTATITDNNGCTASQTATVSDVITAPTLTTVIANNTTCNGGNGSIDLSVTPASNNTYSWSGGETTQDLANLVPGTYTVTVTQGVTCTATGSYTVADVPNRPLPTAVATGSTCNLPNGSINATVTGGVSPYTYEWSSGQTSEDLSNIDSGTYTVTVTGANGCTQTVSVTVGNTDPPFGITATTQPNTTCNGGNGSIDLTPNPAVPPAPLSGYTYDWSNGETTQDITGLIPGTYTVTVSSGGTCTRTGTYTIADVPNLPVPTATFVGSTCNLENGSIDASVTGGVSPYTYLWSGNNGTTQDLTNIGPGSYTLTVTGANGCTQTISVTVTNTDPPFTLTGSTQPNTNCTGGNGSIDLMVSPAVPPAPLGNYMYDWSNGGTDQDLSNLPPGDYTVTVSAGGTCTRSATFTIVDNPNLPSPTATPTQSTCGEANGSINASVSGGVQPFTYSWSNGATTEDLAMIFSGTYTLTVTGANGCTRSITVDVLNNNPVINLSAITVANTVCNGGDGSINLTASPAGPPYIYNWSNGATTQDITDLPPGNYTVTVTNGNTCTASATYTVADNPNLPVPTATSVQSTCDLPNGSINASVSGGVAPYTYAWSNGATTQDLADILPGTYTLTVTGANGCTRLLSVTVGNNNPPINLSATIVANTLCVGGNGSINLTAAPANPNYTFTWSNGATTEDISNLTPGNYTVTVSAGGTCTASATYNVPDGPNLPLPTATTVQSTCDLPNGSIDLSVTGGVPPYTFNWSNGATTQDISNVLAGTYMVTVTAANGCSRVLNVTLANNNPPINLSSVIVANTFCTGGNGSIDLTASPSGPPYTYVWSNGPTTQDITNLPPGNYTVTVSAGGTCTASATYNVPDNPNLPLPTATFVQSTCNLANGSIDASVSGGLAPYTYAWSNGATTQDLSGLLSGSYTLTVTGANGCTRAITVDVTNNNPPINLSSVIVANTVCNGGNGSIDLTAAPAGPPYTYTWSNGATTQDIANLPPGSYTVTVSAGGTCTNSATFNVPDNPNLPNVTAVPTQSTCSQSNGSIDASVSGGVAPYTYLWSYNNGTTQDLNNIPAGNYVLTVTGANGCTRTISVDVGNNNPPITVTATSMPNTVCNANPNGSINITVAPPNPAYTFLWSNGATTEDLSGVAQGNYTVTVTLIGTCTQVATFTVPDNPNSPAIVSSVVNTTCGFANGSINLTVNGGPTPYTFLWAPNGSTTQNQTMLLAGDYSVTVTATNGCTAAANITVVNNNPPINLSAVVLPNTTCNNSPTGNVNLSVAPPGPPYTYTWSNGATTQDIGNLPPGDYTVTVSAGGTCIEFATYTVPDLPNAPFASVVATNANCGLPNGSINLTPSGGIMPYTYAWSSGQTTQDLNNITGGLYQVVVTGANGCTVEAFVDVPNDDIPIDIDATVMDKTSCIINNGSISITVTPSTASVIWSNGSTSKNLVSLSPGDYSVTVSMGGTCTMEATYSILDNTELPILSADILPAICGFTNGSIDLSADFGIPPYTYDWGHIPGNNNQQDLINLPTGNYVVTVTTSAGCTEVLIAPVDNEIIPIDIYFQTSDDLSCTSNNGFIDIDVEPILNYTYDWAHIQGPNNPPDLNNLAAGTYSVTVSFGTCKANTFFDIFDATEPPSVSISNTPSICSSNNGTVTLNVSGATAPYTFDWAHLPGNNNPKNLSGLSPGTYIVTVTDFFDCTATASTTVVNNTIVLNLSGIPIANTSCAAPNGALDVSVVPVGNYIYTWSNAATTQDLTGIAPGLYTVTASAGVGCTSSATFQVGNNTVNPVLSPVVTAAICSQNNGDIQVTTTSGTAPYTYLWSNAATTEDLNAIFPGNYSLTITDANGCTSDTTLNVANNATTFSLSGTASPYNDCASINGAVNLTVTPAGPYTYLWSTGATTQDLTGMPAGTYTVEVTEQGTCIASATYFVLDERTWPTLNQNVVAELCNLMDANVNISIFGGLAPFNYAWTSGHTTEDLTNIGGGTYTITVTGANNCSAVATANVPENSINFSLDAIAVPNSSCVVLNGSIDLNITPPAPGGGPGYTYIWSGGYTTQDLNGVTAGTYAVTVSAGGTCTNTASYVVDDAAGAPGIAGSITAALCGQSSGDINLSVNGGTAPYSYIWSNGQTDQDLNDVLSGNYDVTVTGANGCQAADSYNVAEDVITPNLSGVSQPNTACIGPNGSINLNISPSSLTYTIIWSTGATTQNISNLTPDTYSVTVNGGGACIASATYVVTDNTAFITAGGTDVDILCFGGNTGSIDLVLTGGSSPFDYAWTPFLNNVEDPSGLTAGNYTVIVTDAVGCTATRSFTISQPVAAVQVSCASVSNVTQPGFADGKAQVQISGGVAPYSVLLNPGGIQGGIPAGTFPLNNLGVGSYNVTVTDANGCTAVCDFTILLNPCATAVGTMGTAQLSHCSTGCITANYDALGQVLDPNDVLQFILHLGPDSLIVGEKARSSTPTFCFNQATMTYSTTYYISAVVGNNDGNGNVVLAHYCTVIATGTPIVFYEKPVASAIVPEPITCAKLQVSLLGSSNLPNPTYQWSTTNGFIVGPTNQANIEANQSGDYRLIVAVDGCPDTTIAEVLDIRNDPEAKLLASPNDILDCKIDEIILAGEIKGSSNANTIWFDQNGVIYSGGTVLKIDDPGTYWFAIVDTVTFCSDTASIFIGQDQLYPPLFINPPDILTCDIGSVTLSGGSPISGILFQWATVIGSDTTILGSGTSLIVTQPNTYRLFGYDPVNGCNNSMSIIVVADKTYPTASTGPPFSIDCYGEALTINGSATGGTGVLTYSWTTSGGLIISGANTPTPTIGEPGTYTLLVTATGNGCSDTDAVVITPNEPQAIATVNHPACYGYKGSILVDTVLGAKPPLEYTFTGGPHLQSGNLFSNLAAGDYSIFIEDANGCTTSVDETVIEPDEFVVTVDPQATIQLGDSYQVGATVNIPNSEIASIQWTPPTWLRCDTCLSTWIDTPLTSQTYRIFVVSTSGCRDDAPFQLRVNRDVKVYIPNIFSPDDDGENDWFTVFADLKGVKHVQSLQIFDRWGNQVFLREDFQPNDPTLGWDGRFRGLEMNPAVFVYYAVVEFIDGQEVLFKGDVTLQR